MVKTTNFFNDCMRLLKFLLNGFKDVRKKEVDSKFLKWLSKHARR